MRLSYHMLGILSKNIFYSSDLVSPSPPSLAGVSELTSDSASPSATSSSYFIEALDVLTWQTTVLSGCKIV